MQLHCCITTSLSVHISKHVNTQTFSEMSWDSVSHYKKELPRHVRHLLTSLSGHIGHQNLELYLQVLGTASVVAIVEGTAQICMKGLQTSLNEDSLVHRTPERFCQVGGRTCS